MLNIFKKMKKETRCLTVTSMFLGLIFIILLIVSLCTKLYGLVIGWSIGFAITIVSMFLLFKSGEIMQKTATSDNAKGTGLVILFYASRFGLYALGLVMCALAYKVWNVNAFHYSLYCCVAALLPSHLFIAFLFHDDDTPTVKKEENKENISK